MMRLILIEHIFYRELILQNKISEALLLILYLMRVMTIKSKLIVRKNIILS